jgi:hypothetical protein
VHLWTRIWVTVALAVELREEREMQSAAAPMLAELVRGDRDWTKG